MSDELLDIYVPHERTAVGMQAKADFVVTPLTARGIATQINNKLNLGVARNGTKCPVATRDIALSGGKAKQHFHLELEE